ncbi:MAG: hypothetical protein HYW52_00665, partial [Gemmatimonadetes bacterium]|nr:hypothetical protein [Gemmatimonadota bacterium]
MCSALRHAALLMLAGGSVGGAPAHGQGAPPLVRVTVSGVVGDFQTGGPVVGAFVKVDG